VINDEHLVLREFVKGLNSASRSLDNPLGITFTGVTTAKEALELIETDGDLQAVLVDDTLYTLAPRKSQNGKADTPARELQTTALELVRRITRLRPELDVYILIAQEKEDDVVDALFAEAVDGYFYREERDYRGIYRILNAQIQERARTPFYDALKSYVWMAKDQWHTPGHSSGESLRGSPWVNDFYEFMGEHVFDADLSVSVPMLDSLMEPKGVINEAQQMAAKAFGAPSSPPTAPRPRTRSSSRRCSRRARSCSSTAIATRACTTAWCFPARTRCTWIPRSTGNTASMGRYPRSCC
jgi:arginine decarboxylase